MNKQTSCHENKPIGSCTKTEVLHQAQECQNRGADRYATVYKTIADKLDEDETVCQRLNGVQVETIIQETLKS